MNGAKPARTVVRGTVGAVGSAGTRLVCIGFGTVVRHAFSRVAITRTAIVPDTTTPATEPHTPTITESAIALVYELLDAHADTIEFAEARLGDPSWNAHVEYLRALQRKGREALAHGCYEIEREIAERQ